MVVKLNDIIGDAAVDILRDIYIFYAIPEEIYLKHGLDHESVDSILERASRYLVYEKRLTQYQLSPMSIIFQEVWLEKWIWKEYILEQIQQGKTTGELAEELGRNLEFINAFLT